MNDTAPLRVAMLARAVFPLHGFGGIERHIYHLVKHLGLLGVEVSLFCQPPHDAAALAASDLRPAALRYLRYDYTSPLLPPNGVIGRQINFPAYSLRLGRMVAAEVRRGAFEIVHAQGLCAFGYGLLRQRDRHLRAVPFFANPHGMEEFRTPDWRKWLAYAPFRALYAAGHRAADRAIATDACTRDDLPRYLGVHPERVVVLPSAIDVAECLAWSRPELRADLRQRLNLASASPILLSVGRLEQNKGFHILIAALAALRHELPATWRWLLVGNGSERERLASQAQRAGIADHVTFVGRLSDPELHSLYDEVDLVIHPTLYEGSSLVTLEGMIHHRPMVASAAGGIPDKVFDGRNGYLVRPGDTDDLIAALRRALAQREQWPAWGAESERIVREVFDWPVVARQTLAAYHEARAERRV